jgi:tRNA A-37 threonylcarbamoyl transferase component Bud32/dienelactone hydrolase
MSDPMMTRLAALADRYLVEGEIGHGGMATVYRARDLKHHRLVAIKVLRPELAQAMGGERFAREIKLAAQLQSPHILPLLDSGEIDGLLYYVMPFVDGESLRDLMARDGALPPSEATRLLREIVDGLAHAHRQGFVHRDIKPDNVMLAERHALLMDFGVAKALADGRAGGPTGTADPHVTLTEVGISLGTPAYMAPEQAAADPNIDHRADIYAVGVMAYEMLTGAPPFTGAPQLVIASHITKEPAPIATVQPDVPPALAAIVMRCLAKDPGARYQTADELLQAIEGLVTPGGTAAYVEPAVRRRRTAMITVGVIALAVVGFFGYQKSQRSAWVHQTGLPELRRLAEAAEYDSAFALATEIEAIAPTDTTLQALWPRIARKALIETEPAGVRVYRASVSDTSVWRLIGTTPMDSVMMPVMVGLFRYEKDGYRTHYRLGGSRPPMAILDPLDAPDQEMVRVAGAEMRAFLVGADNNPPVELGAFQLGRFEVSNAAYQRFVDAGGYRDQQYWEHPIVDGERTLTFDEAMARFVDRSGRPGPSTWEGGGFPAGQEDYPVAGVSWYEAAAYAKFAGKSLPTIYHWAEAAGVYYSKFVVPGSNLEGTGPLPVGTPRAVTIAGASDMGGNVREWIMNEDNRGQRFILGGGWSDLKYGFVDAYAQPPMDRAQINGIRLAQYAAAEPHLAQASAPIVRAFTDYSKEVPVSDAVFAGFLQFYDYDPLALNPKVESADTTANWIVELVSIDAAYGGERLPIWIYRPVQAAAPLQSVVFFPGSNAINGPPSAGYNDANAEWIVRSGRAFVIPIYKSTHERSDSLRSDYADMSIFYRDHVTMWVKDYRRTLDYLTSRAEFDSTKFGYMGFSWGGLHGGMVPAIEPRIKASVLYVAGLMMERARPEADVYNFLPRVKSPVIMLNGRDDFFFPLETSQVPFFQRLGTPAADKKHLVYDGGHDVPRTELIKETLAWFDKYLGQVR